MLNRKSRLLVLPLMLLPLMALALAACRPALLDPPRLATVAARTDGASSDDDAGPLLLPAPTPTGPAPGLSVEAPATPAGAEAAPNPELIFWALQNSEEDVAALEALVREVGEQHAINVELFLVEPDLLPDLLQTAVVSPSYPMPHIVMTPLEYTAGWAAAGILDSVQAARIVDDLGRDTFDADALALVENGQGLAAIPSDGWQQLLIYRQDWFDERNLAPPLNYGAMISAGAAISSSVDLLAGFNIPTESSLVATTRIFEQIALANGCQIIDEKGELLLLMPACQEAIEFYRRMCNSFCPLGVQTEISVRNSYLEGRASMIMTTPEIMAQMAGLVQSQAASCPDCAEPDFLAQNSGIVTHLAGNRANGEGANLGNLTYLGITSAADPEIASTFLQYWFEDGYERWLAARPEMKAPLRRGTAANPERFIDSWYQLPMRPGSPTIAELYGQEVADQLVKQVVNPSRWGYGNGHGVLVSQIYEKLTYSILLQELLSGYYDSKRASIQGYKRLVDLIPNYQYYVDPEPTPEPEEE